MFEIRRALPAMAEMSPTIAGELRVMESILVGCPAGLIDLPTQVVLAGFGVIGQAPTDDRRKSYRHVVDATAEQIQKWPTQTDLLVAVRVWGVAIGRAAQVYGAMVTTSFSESAQKEKAATDAGVLAHWIELTALDLHAITETSEGMREVGSPRQRASAEVRAAVASGRLGRVRRIRSTQLSLDWEVV